MITFSLFYRESCHLCEVMLHELSPYLEREDVQLERIDIDEHPEWLDAYNTFVPVLHIDDEPVCKYKLDKAKVEHFLLD